MIEFLLTLILVPIALIALLLTFLMLVAALNTLLGK